MLDIFVVPVEVRESDGGPMLRGTVIQEGRAATGGRAELFSPFSVPLAGQRDRHPRGTSRV